MTTLTEIAKGLINYDYEPEKVESWVNANKAVVLTSYIINPDAKVDLVAALAYLDGDDGLDTAKNFVRLCETRADALNDAIQMIKYRMDCLLNPEPDFPCPVE